MVSARANSCGGRGLVTRLTFWREGREGALGGGDGWRILMRLPLGAGWLLGDEAVQSVPS